MKEVKEGKPETKEYGKVEDRKRKRSVSKNIINTNKSQDTQMGEIDTKNATVLAKLGKKPKIEDENNPNPFPSNQTNSKPEFILVRAPPGNPLLGPSPHRGSMCGVGLDGGRAGAGGPPQPPQPPPKIQHLVEWNKEKTTLNIEHGKEYQQVVVVGQDHRPNAYQNKKIIEQNKNNKQEPRKNRSNILKYIEKFNNLESKNQQTESKTTTITKETKQEKSTTNTTINEFPKTSTNGTKQQKTRTTTNKQDNEKNPIDEGNKGTKNSGNTKAKGRPRKITQLNDNTTTLKEFLELKFKARESKCSEKTTQNKNTLENSAADFLTDLGEDGGDTKTGNSSTIKGE